MDTKPKPPTRNERDAVVADFAARIFERTPFRDLAAAGKFPRPITQAGD